MAVKVREKVKDSGEWWVFISHQGKRRSKKIGDKRTANAVARKVRERLAEGDMGIVKDRCPTLSEYGKRWLASPFHDWRDSTRVVYTRAFDMHVKPMLGGKPLDEIKRVDIKELIAKLKSNDKSSSRMRTITGVVSGIFNSAIEDEIVSMNPCQKVGKYTGFAQKGKIDPLTSDEVIVLLQNAFQTLYFGLYTLILLAVRTGDLELVKY